MKDDASILSYNSLRRSLHKFHVLFRKITAIFQQDYGGLQLRKPWDEFGQFANISRCKTNPRLDLSLRHQTCFLQWPYANVHFIKLRNVFWFGFFNFLFWRKHVPAPLFQSRFEIHYYTNSKTSPTYTKYALTCKWGCCCYLCTRSQGSLCQRGLLSEGYMAVWQHQLTQL